MNLKRAMNRDVKEYADRPNSNKMKKSSDSIENGQDEMKNLEEKLMKSFYHHLSNCNERNDATCNSSGISANIINNLNRNSDTANGKPRNGDYTSFKNSSYRNIYGSSSSEDDDEHCVYTYKGAEMAAVSESFFNVGVEVPNGRNDSLCSSPDMDYLEMDFDPGPSNEQDSDSDNASHNIPDTEEDRNDNHDASDEGEDIDCDENANCYDKMPIQVLSSSSDETSNLRNFKELSPNNDNEQPCCSKSLDNERRASEDKLKSNQCYIYCDTSDEDLPRGSRVTDRDDITFIADEYREDRSSSEIECDQDSSFACIPDADNIEEHFYCYDSLLPMDPTYSISAVVNLLTALHIPHDSLSTSRKLSELLKQRRILKNTSLVDYLFLRAVQGANEADILHFLSASSERKLHSRFFTTYPKRNVDYLEWMSRWIKKGALPVVTRNVQERGTLAVKRIIYNQWRHNVVFKIESGNVSLTNPLEHVEESVLSRQLCQAPLIYVRRSSVVRRWHSKVDLRPLLKPTDHRWCTENVLGQLASVIREHCNNTKTRHYIRIPSNCQCGITLFAPSENLKLCREIDEAPELPLALVF